MILVIVFIVFIFFACEVSMYLSHRFLGHGYEITPLRRSHRIHHISHNDHHAHEDFMWGALLLLLLIVLVWTVMGFNNEYSYLFTVSIGVVVFVVVFNWYIHEAYHHKGHMLERYQWFRNSREEHLQHHQNPHANYGIATSFSDVIFGTSYRESR